MVIFSDEKNHSSMIEGIKSGKRPKHIFRHNDIDHLEQLLKSIDIKTPKIIALESVYSMDGDVAPLIIDFLHNVGICKNIPKATLVKV